MIAAGSNRRPPPLLGCLRLAVRGTVLVKTNRINRGGKEHRSAALVRLCHDLRTQAYLSRRTAEGMSKIIPLAKSSIIRKPAQILDRHV